MCGNADEVVALAGLRDAVEAAFVSSLDLFDRAELAQADLEDLNAGVAAQSSRSDATRRERRGVVGVPVAQHGVDR